MQKVFKQSFFFKGNFFVRYRTFESWAHLNQLAERWLKEEADQRMHGTLKEIVAERFEREAPTLRALPRVRYDTSYFEYRRVAARRAGSAVDRAGNAGRGDVAPVGGVQRVPVM